MNSAARLDIAAGIGTSPLILPTQHPTTMMRSRHTLAALLLAPAPALAADVYLLAGAESASGARYAYVGAVLPLAAAGSGFKQRYWADRQTYEYDAGPGRITAHARGLEGALGYGGATANGWWSAFAGVRFSETTLTPDDPGGSARGHQAALKLQIEGDTRIVGEVRLGGVASYTARLEQYWARARVSLPLGAGANVGPEVTLSGSPESNARAFGVFATLTPGQGAVSFTLKAGRRTQDGARNSYAGVESVFAF